ncbi:hypothetical protein E6C50_14050 [Flavobacterium supellecticarium]|uniref:Uncharacterized protein n=1 Tax=Flavobacterium supellecticarium TaxID=2565924 RepID=A0A4S3ZTD0_9FLAO|nr:hypothetical protein [Flavobacterium supellecticarium]THF48867.1 hypothetical protein E6C50_14050 [Flavobacterium supellecticarium]
MSTKKYLIDTLKATEKSEFDAIVKTYLGEVYGYRRIVNTDGVNDAGIDIKIFDIVGVKNQYQLTIQKSETTAEKSAFEKKLFEDVAKAKVNYLDNNYSNVLYFFYSHPLTNKVIHDYKAKALRDYGISLIIIEAKQIAEEAGEYLQLLNEIVSTNDIKDVLKTENLFPKDDKNLVFDLLSFGQASDFRLQIIEAYILRQVHLKKEMSKKEIIDICEEQFKSQENKVFYDKLFARLQSESKLIFRGDKFELTDKESKKISGLIGQNEVEEATFINSLEGILKKNNQEDNIEEYLTWLKKVYITNFNSDISEILSEGSKDLSSISREFLQFLTSKGFEESEAKEIAKELFSVCKQNTYLQKFCAAKVFNETTSIKNIERYINTKKRIFVDTQIILYALCYYYNAKSEFSNYFYLTTKSLLNFTSKNKTRLYLPNLYLWEAQSHLREALNLIPFTNLPNFEKLGRSRNVFYNFFLSERESHSSGLSYKDFFNKLGFREYDKFSKHNSLIKKYISELGIEVVEIDNQFYDIEEPKKIIQAILYDDNKFKSKFGLNNDAIILEYFANGDVDVHPLQPLLLSWDKVLFKSQKEYFKRNPASERWFLLTPERFIDQYSLLQFTIDSETVTNEILAFLSNDLIKGTHSLLDSITHILNPTEEVGLQYANRLSEIRDNEIHRLKEYSITLPEDVEGEAVIDDLMYNLTSYYRENKDVFEDFKKVFENIDLLDEVMQIIKQAIEEIYTNKRLDDAIVNDFDKLIVKSKK